MKRSCLYLLFVLFLLSSCNKESDTVAPPKRGDIVSTVDLGVYTKTAIQVGLIIQAGDYVNDIDFNYDVDLVKVVYKTIDVHGELCDASGLAIIPRNAPDSLPMASYQHGTILKKSDVPSRQGGGYEIGLVLGTIGYITACPDYLGLGDSKGLHPYMHAESEATAVIDMLRATRKLCENRNVKLNQQLFLLGYSQGGHSTMAALKMLEEKYTDEFKVTACAPMAGAYDMSGTQMNFMLRDTAYVAPGYLPYLLYGYNLAYNLYPNLDTIFKSPYNTQFPAYFTDNTTLELGSVNALWPATRIPTEVLNPNVLKAFRDDPNFPFTQAIRKNDLYGWKPVTPMRLCHCDKDVHVPYRNSEVAFNSFKDKGATDILLINPLPGGDHTTCVLPSMVYAIKWFNTLKK